MVTRDKTFNKNVWQVDDDEYYNNKETLPDDENQMLPYHNLYSHFQNLLEAHLVYVAFFEEAGHVHRLVHVQDEAPNSIQVYDDICQKRDHFEMFTVVKSDYGSQYVTILKCLRL